MQKTGDAEDQRPFQYKSSLDKGQSRDKLSRWNRFEGAAVLVFEGFPRAETDHYSMHICAAGSRINTGQLFIINRHDESAQLTLIGRAAIAESLNGCSSADLRFLAEAVISIGEDTIICRRAVRWETSGGKSAGQF